MKDFNKILEPKVQDFIKTYEKKDVANLVLKGSPFNDVDIQQIAQQVKGRQVAKNKFPNLYEANNIIYSPKLNLEQASSQVTAEYKASILSEGNSIVDLTGGFGIDTLAFSTKFKNINYCELNFETYAYAKHNFKILNQNIRTYHTDGIQFLKNSNEQFDWIFIDPARRDSQANKVFRLEDCTPNILENLDLFGSKTSKMMVKTSPLLDFNLCLKQIPNISEIHIVASENEVKELLLVIDFKANITKPKVKAINLGTSQNSFTNNYEDLSVKQEFSMPQNFLYEPNPAIMKSGFFGSLCKEYSVSALALNSHLFTSEYQINFPGRCFEIIKVIAPKQKEINKYLSSKQGNISTRNYPLKPQQIKQKYKIKDGGLNFVFFTENMKKEKIVLICKKIKQK